MNDNDDTCFRWEIDKLLNKLIGDIDFITKLVDQDELAEAILRSTLVQTYLSGFKAGLGEI